MEISLCCPFLSPLLVFVLLTESPGVFVRQPSRLADEDVIYLFFLNASTDSKV